MTLNDFRYPALILALIICYFFGNTYFISLLVIIALHSMAAIGLSLLSGYAGQISLGHAAFYGIGAYASGLIALHTGITPWITIPMSAVIAGAVAWGVGPIMFKLKGHHLAMATLAFGIIVHVALVEMRGITGGPNGMGGIPPLSILGTPLLFDEDIFPLVWGVVIIMVFVSENLIRSPHGLTLRAIGSREHVVPTLGSDTNKSKRLVLIISAVFAAIAGAIYGHYIGYLSPGPFSTTFSVQLLVMVAIGGFSRIWGVVLGVIFVTLLSEWLKPFGDVELLLYGALLIFTMIYCPNGLLSQIGVIASKAARNLRQRTPS